MNTRYARRDKARDPQKKRWGVTPGRCASALERGQATVFTRQHQFRIGAPVHFDRAYEAVSALEYVLGAIGADLVNGLQILARKRRVAIEQVEAVVEGELNNPLTYLGVIGETGHPGLEKVRIRVYLASPEEEATIQRLWQEMLSHIATGPHVSGRDPTRIEAAGESDSAPEIKAAGAGAISRRVQSRTEVSRGATDLGGGCAVRSAR